MYKRQGLAGLRAELAALDPVSAERLQDARRIVRALEVCRLTGRPFSAFMPERTYAPEVAPVVQLGLRLDRAELHQRIAARVERMLAEGLLDEVRRLDVPGPDGLRQGPTASRAIGYAQMLAVLDGELTEAEAAEQTVVATRRFARRQETWFRADPRVVWLDAQDEDVVAEALAVVAGDAT